MTGAVSPDKVVARRLAAVLVLGDGFLITGDHPMTAMKEIVFDSDETLDSSPAAAVPSDGNWDSWDDGVIAVKRRCTTPAATPQPKARGSAPECPEGAALSITDVIDDAVDLALPDDVKEMLHDGDIADSDSADASGDDSGGSDDGDGEPVAPTGLIDDGASSGSNVEPTPVLVAPPLVVVGSDVPPDFLERTSGVRTCTDLFNIAPHFSTNHRWELFSGATNIGAIRCISGESLQMKCGHPHNRGRRGKAFCKMHIDICGLLPEAEVALLRWAISGAPEHMSCEQHQELAARAQAQWRTRCGSGASSSSHQ